MRGLNWSVRCQKKELKLNGKKTLNALKDAMIDMIRAVKIVVFVKTKVLKNVQFVLFEPT